MTDMSENRFYQGEAGRIPWMKRDVPRVIERSPSPTTLKMKLHLAWAAITSVAKDVVMRNGDEDY